MEGIIVPIFFFTAVVIIWGGFILTRHKERIVAMEKGLKAEEVRVLYERSPFRSNPLASLKWGIVFVCIGIAVLLSMWLHQAFMVEEGVYPGLIALFGGLGLIVFYALTKKKTTQQ